MVASSIAGSFGYIYIYIYIYIYYIYIHVIYIRYIYIYIYIYISNCCLINNQLSPNLRKVYCHSTFEVSGNCRVIVTLEENVVRE